MSQCRFEFDSEIDSAIMYAFVSDTYLPQDDDISTLLNLYGSNDDHSNTLSPFSTCGCFGCIQANRDSTTFLEVPVVNQWYLSTSWFDATTCGTGTPTTVNYRYVQCPPGEIDDVPDCPEECEQGGFIRVNPTYTDGINCVVYLWDVAGG